jgi:hypothetical protein
MDLFLGQHFLAYKGIVGENMTIYEDNASVELAKVLAVYLIL